MLTILPLLSSLLLGGCPLEDKDDDTSPHEDGGTHEDGGSEAEEADFHWPSTEGYTDPGIPGWVGRTRISTTEGCWSDTDGVDPGLAGCHSLHASGDECGTCDPEVNETIGEACYTFSHTTESGETEQATYLIETNPGVDQCHLHAGGVGHPDVFDCDAYCKGSTDPETGAAYSSGSCEAIVGQTCRDGTQDSAFCACAL